MNMSYIKRFFGHLKTVLTHKYWVFYYASRLGIVWQGLVHDLSKFSPVEFFEGVKYWTGKRSPILVAKEQAGISYAWLHHRGRNKHHYEYWIEKLDTGGVPHKIPFKYVVEIVCDWLGACRSYEKNNDGIFQKESDWWQGHVANVKMHEETKALITSILARMVYYYNESGSEKVALRRTKWFIEVSKKYYDDPEIIFTVVPIMTPDTKITITFNE